MSCTGHAPTHTRTLSHTHARARLSALYERLNIALLREDIARRVLDLEKNMMGVRHELVVLQSTSDAASARYQQTLLEKAEQDRQAAMARFMVG